MDPQSLADQILALQTQLANTQQDLVNAQQAAQAAQQQARTARQLAAQQPAQQPAQQAAATAPKIKFKLPDAYDGRKRGKASELFLSSCALYMRARHTEFPDDASKISFVLSYLTDIAASWAHPILEDWLGPQADATSYDWDAFKDAFEAAFGDPDKEGAAIRALDKLKQTKSVAEYAAEFRRLKVDITWNESAFLHHFRQGLKDDVKDVLAQTGIPDTLAELVERSQRIDERLYERRQEKAAHSHSTHKPAAHQPRNTPTPATNVYVARPQQAPQVNIRVQRDPNAMEIDANGRPRITAAERERRRSNRLCFRCGQAGHQAKDHDQGAQGAIEEGRPVLQGGAEEGPAQGSFENTEAGQVFK